ncbi:MAG: hypothetical protein QOF29_2316 [bacterium]
MTCPRRALLAGACALVAALAAGCGADRDPAATKPDAAPSAAVPPPVNIERPRPGAAVRARRQDGSNVAVTVTVAGRADALQTVFVQAGCAAPECRQVAFSDAEGRWTASLELVLPARRDRLDLTAGYATASASDPSARVRVSVRAPKRSATAARRESRRSTEQGPRSPRTSPAPAPRTSPRSPGPAAPAPAPSPPATSPPARGTGSERRALVLVGDSLAVGVRSLLAPLLPGWQVRVDGRTGRPLAEGMGIVAGTPLPSDGSTVLAISLFTNDDPTETRELEAAVRASLARAGSNGCVLWATIVRPPLNGVGYQAANSLLRRLAEDDERLRIVPWAEEVAARPSLLGGDGIHATPQGYQARAQLYARSAQSC